MSADQCCCRSCSWRPPGSRWRAASSAPSRKKRGMGPATGELWLAGTGHVTRCAPLIGHRQGGLLLLGPVVLAAPPRLLPVRRFGDQGGQEDHPRGDGRHRGQHLRHLRGDAAAALQVPHHLHGQVVQLHLLLLPGPRLPAQKWRGRQILSFLHQR